MTAQIASTQVLHAEGAKVEVRYLDDHTVRVDVESTHTGPGAWRAGELTCEAVRDARRRHARSVHTALQVGLPSCGIVLEALRRSEDAAEVQLRRAGSSIMVTVPLRP